MATATMTYNGAADGVPTATLTHIGTVPDAIVANFFAAYRANFGQIQSKDANGVLLWLVNGQQVALASAPALGASPVMRDMTDAETWERYTQGIASGTADFVQRYMIEQAKAQAVAAAQAQLAQATVTQQS